MRRLTQIFARAIIGLVICLPLPADGAETKAPAPANWQTILGAAKKEGKLVAAIPASAELRKGIEEVFKARYPGIELELFPSRGPSNANRVISEHKAGVRYFDLLISGTSTPFGLLKAGIIEPFEPYMVLPEVSDPKKWWGGHIWIDNAKRYIYSFQAYQTESIWYNTTMVKPEEIRSYDDLLNPKWKGKIGYLDPKTPGAGTASWAFLWKIKGEEYLRKLAMQDLFLSQDQRQLADGLAKGRFALVIGLTYYTFLPHVKAGLPVKALPDVREGDYVTCGSAALSLVKDPPHPNAAKVFVNWLLGQEAQELYTKAMGQGTRRLDVDTKWLTQIGVKASKDFMTVEEHFRLENYGEDTVMNVWAKSVELAEKVLK